MVSVTADDLRRITATVYKSLRTLKEDAKGHRFGTFRITIVEGKSKKKRILPADKTEMPRILSRDAMVLLLNAIEEVERTSSAENKELRITIANLKGHLI